MTLEAWLGVGILGGLGLFLTWRGVQTLRRARAIHRDDFGARAPGGPGDVTRNPEFGGGSQEGVRTFGDGPALGAGTIFGSGAADDPDGDPSWGAFEDDPDRDPGWGAFEEEPDQEADRGGFEDDPSQGSAEASRGGAHPETPPALAEMSSAFREARDRIEAASEGDLQGIDPRMSTSQQRKLVESLIDAERMGPFVLFATAAWGLLLLGLGLGLVGGAAVAGLWAAGLL